MVINAIVRGIGALFMLLAALLLAPGVQRNFERWQYLSPSYRAVNIILLAGLAGLLAGAVLLLSKKTWRRPALLAGGAGASLIGATLMWGVLSGVIPCSGPS